MYISSLQKHLAHSYDDLDYELVVLKTKLGLKHIHIVGCNVLCFLKFILILLNVLYTIFNTDLHRKFHYLY